MDISPLKWRFSRLPHAPCHMLWFMHSSVHYNHVVYFMCSGSCTQKGVWHVPCSWVWDMFYALRMHLSESWVVHGTCHAPRWMEHVTQPVTWNMSCTQEHGNFQHSEIVCPLMFLRAWDLPFSLDKTKFKIQCQDFPFWGILDPAVGHVALRALNP